MNRRMLRISKPVLKLSLFITPATALYEPTFMVKLVHSLNLTLPLILFSRTYHIISSPMQINSTHPLNQNSQASVSANPLLIIFYLRKYPT